MQGNPVVCCSSPERFLRLDRAGTLEARPIKGTAARIAGDAIADAAAAAALRASEKDRAENLMIVDLLRNDLGRVCEPGSVHVPGLMEVRAALRVALCTFGLRSSSVASDSCGCLAWITCKHVPIYVGEVVGFELCHCKDDASGQRCGF